MGVISEADKKNLLERLAKAREAKAAKKKAQSAAAPATTAPVPDVAPAPPEPLNVAAPLSVAAPEEIAPPPVPDLVAASAALIAKKPKQKKVKLPESSSDSDSDDEPVLPPKKNKGANKRSGNKHSGVPYMKIKIYKESPKALESIMQTIQDNQEEEETPIPMPSGPIPIPVAKPRTVCMTGSRPSTNTQVLRAGTLRDAALAFFS